MKIPLAILLILLNPSLKSGEQVLIRGIPVDRGTFPEALYVRNQVGEQCSATVVGKYAILTAAHCVERSKVIQVIQHDWLHMVASCETHDKWDGFDFDIALCKTEFYVPVHPASLRLAYPRLGQQVILSGFGCTNLLRTGGNNGIFSVGVSTVSELPGDTNFFQTYQEAAVCSGDSGGAAYLMMDDPGSEDHYIIGVNSRGDMVERSLMTSIFTLPVIRWIKDWSRRYHTKICGVNRNCDRIHRPGTPAVF